MGTHKTTIIYYKRRIGRLSSCVRSLHIIIIIVQSTYCRSMLALHTYYNIIYYYYTFAVEEINRDVCWRSETGESLMSGVNDKVK